MADMYYKGHWYGADDREEFLDMIRVGESNVSMNIWEGGFLPPYTVAEAKEAYAMGLYHDRENGRTARKELSVYDAMLAEIYAEHDGSKARVRNRRRNDRKHNVLPKVRKQMRYDRGWNRYRSMPCYGCKNIGIAEYRMDNAESVARADWKLESAEIAEDEMIARFNAELEEFDRKWREEAEAEQRRMREYRKMRELNDWLKYA